MSGGVMHPSQPLIVIAHEIERLRNMIGTFILQSEVREENPELRSELRTIVRQLFESEHALQDAHHTAVTGGRQNRQESA